MLKHFVVIKLILSFIIPYIILFAIYIQFNGEVSPGGGFQAGVIFATGMIGYELVFGTKQFLKTLSVKILTICGILGVMIYFSTGLIPMIFQGVYLDYNYLNEKPILGQHIGIFAIEIGVGLTVASIMCLIYILLKED